MKKLQIAGLFLTILSLALIVAFWGLPIFAYQESYELSRERQVRLTPSLNETGIDKNLGELGGFYTFSITLKGEASLVLEVYLKGELVDTIGISNSINNGEYFRYESNERSFFGEDQILNINIKALTFYDDGWGEKICEFDVIEHLKNYGGRPAGADYLFVGGIIGAIIGVSLLIISGKRNSHEN